ncbi:hypothetical protein LTS08_004786 [Lithohypha guttulata]|uniref:DUF7907 domain-containing protein n=1 Tax=Lithohypha guttulata TaxID=1690604 RepID=A0AAN7YC54_9EURO|nr:hypothetical protein LTR05_002372 [Lithohypha guttulata]KAK5101180.1 hypothetical protein LTS08_004786 [Lithohypha guttulata]
MHLSTILASVVLTIASLTTAQPLEVRQAPDRFYLQTQVVPGINDCGSNKQGLYVYSYHTGAGLGVAAASADSSDDSWFYLNGTQLMWTYEGNTIGPWPVVVSSYPYQAFNPISISIASAGSQEGYSTNGTGLQSTAAGGGWIACDWWFTAPQIFAVTGYRNTPLPTSCSKVNLILVPVA